MAFPDMAFQKTRLSVNLNKIATLRNARGKDIPNLAHFARIALGTEIGGITIHPRPDGRHIRREDVFHLKELLKDFPEKELNIEGFPSPSFLELVEEALPEQCTLVPDPPHVLTSNAGWDFSKNQNLLESSLKRLKAMGVRLSLFLDPLSMDDRQYKALSKIAPNRVELYTESYAESFFKPSPQRQTLSLYRAGREKGGIISSSQRQTLSLYRAEREKGGVISSPKRQILSLYRKCADRVLDLGIDLNAGHDLNRENLLDLLKALPEIKEVSIGQALVAEALEEGFQSSIQSYLQIINQAFLTIK